MATKQTKRLAKSEISNKAVSDVFATYPLAIHKKLLAIRKLIYSVAQSSPLIGEIEETLKWGEPSYLPRKKNVGTTVRIHWLEKTPDHFGVYVNCQTTLIRDFKKFFPMKFKYEGTRAIIFSADDKIPMAELEDCIYLALTYHLQK